MILPSADRDRFLKILALLGSDHAGERDSASLAAIRFLRQRKLMWCDVIAADAPAVLPTPRPTSCHWRQIVQACLRHSGGLRQWETRFLNDLLGFPRVSPKQRVIVHEIAARLGILADAA